MSAVRPLRPRSPSSPVARPLRTVVAHAIPASWRAAASLVGYRRYGRPLPLAYLAPLAQTAAHRPILPVRSGRQSAARTGSSVHARVIGSRARTLVPRSPNSPVYPSYYPHHSSVIVRRRIHLSTSLRPGWFATSPPLALSWSPDGHSVVANRWISQFAPCPRSHAANHAHVAQCAAPVPHCQRGLRPQPLRYASLAAAPWQATNHDRDESYLLALTAPTLFRVRRLELHTWRYFLDATWGQSYDRPLSPSAPFRVVLQRCVSASLLGRPLSWRQRNRRTQSKAVPSVQLHLVSPCGTDLTPPTNPSQWHYALPDISRPPPDEPSALPSSSWWLVPQLFHSQFSPARRAREPYLSPAPRWGLSFVPRSRSSRPLLCPSASHQTPPLPMETRRALPCASVAVARSHPSASGWSSLIVPAVRIYSSHALGHRATRHSWPRLRLETPLPYGSGVWRRLLSNRPSILGQFDARPPPLHQAKLGTGRVAKH